MIAAANDECVARPLTESEAFQLQNLQRFHEDAKRYSAYRWNLLERVTDTLPTFTQELIKEAAEAKAREIIAARTIERLFPGRVS